MPGLSTWQQLAADPDNPTESQLTLLRRSQTAPTSDHYGVVFAHGASAVTLSTDPGFAAQALACPVWGRIGLSGFSAISRNFSGDHWGNDTGIARMDQAYAWHQAHGAKAGKVVLLAFSMGGLLALNYAQRNPAKVACCVLMCPVLSLKTVHDGNQGGYQSDIETAYGGSVAYAAAVNAHDPLTFAASLTTPVKVYYSTDDFFCTPAYVTTLTSSSGGSLASLSMGASGHSMTNVPPDDALAFIAANV